MKDMTNGFAAPIRDKQSPATSEPTALSSETLIAVWVLAAAALVACGDAGAEPDESTGPGTSSLTARAGAGVVEKANFGPNEFADADNCSGLQQQAVFAAEDLADVLIGRAQDALAQMYIDNDLGTRFIGSNPTFEGYFGPLNETTWAELYDRYTGISVAMRSNVYSCNVDGDIVGIGSAGENFVCGSASVLAVTQGPGSSVRLCPEFFKSTTSQDAGVIIHETSHQDRTYSNFGGSGSHDVRDAVPSSAASIGNFAQRFDCAAGSSSRCPTLF